MTLLLLCLPFWAGIFCFYHSRVSQCLLAAQWMIAMSCLIQPSSIPLLSIVMLILVSFISLIIFGYARCYMTADPKRRLFLARLCWVSSSVTLLILSTNLLTAFIAWQCIGLTLYWLLNHYAHKPRAHQAAVKKFMVNRIGDICFLSAVILSYQYWGSSDYSVIIHAQHSGGIAVLLMIAIMTKSALFPFHVWLPDTLETPTPVSALMHAGVINAGGFLLLRLAPLFYQHAPVMLALLLIGLISALFGSFCMLTCSHVKQKLAYSTMGQMGFMVFQFGLGVFTAPLLHMMTHGLFKAGLFLNNGNRSWVITHFIKPSAIRRLCTAFISTSVALLILWYCHLSWSLSLPPVLFWGFSAITVAQACHSLLQQRLSWFNLVLSAIGLVFIINLYCGWTHLLCQYFPECSSHITLSTSWQWLIISLLFAWQWLGWLIPKNKLMQSAIGQWAYRISLQKGYIDRFYQRLQQAIRIPISPQLTHGLMVLVALLLLLRGWL